ncbi:MAG: hypothetical protein SCH71_17550 [Desulfobulbaceae bacterium]|nr:hypothetical protein [Desulfobulbaceae bacterium]
MDFYQVKNGDYSVEVNLNNLFTGNQDHLNSFYKHYDFIAYEDKDFKSLVSLVDGILRYESETVLPLIEDDFKPRVLLVFGNPATHSVKHGMFYFSMGGDNFYRHGLWGKLLKAGLVSEVKSNTTDNYQARKKEANLRKLMILAGKSSDNYLVGLTTFYSLPTPGSFDSEYSGVAAVEKLFRPVLDTVARAEVKRIQSYPFTRGATVVFTQKSSYEMYSEITGATPEFWPIMGKDSGGERLAELLSDIHHTPTTKDWWEEG